MGSGACDGDAAVAPETFNDCGGPRSSERLEGDGEAFSDPPRKGNATHWKQVRDDKSTQIKYGSGTKFLDTVEILLNPNCCY